MNEGTSRTVLKRGLLGSVSRIELPAPGGRPHLACIERDCGDARWWLRPAARRLAMREACALETLRNVPGVPRLLQWDGRRLQRSWLEGEPMQRHAPREPAYFREALRLVRRLHAAGVVHNDLAEEPNWLVAPDGSPAVVDFQLALRPRHRGWHFRARAYDDLRHLLKHKRTYCPERLTARQRRVLAQRSWPAAFWRLVGKPVYRWVARHVPDWSGREGAGDRVPPHRDDPS